MYVFVTGVYEAILPGGIGFMYCQCRPAFSSDDREKAQPGGIVTFLQLAAGGNGKLGPRGIFSARGPQLKECHNHCGAYSLFNCGKLMLLFGGRDYQSEICKLLYNPFSPNRLSSNSLLGEAGNRTRDKISKEKKACCYPQHHKPPQLTSVG